MAEHISTINKAGEDFPTLTLWEEAYDYDITSGDAEVAECYADYGALSDSVLISGGTSDADSYYSIRAPVGERHLGIAGAGFVLQNDNGEDSIRIGSQHLYVEWIEIDGNGNNRDGIDSGAGAGSFYGYFRNLIIHDTGSAYGLTFAEDNNIESYNVFMWDVQRAAHATASGSTTVKLWNWTVYGDGDYGILRALCTNCYAGGFSTADMFQLSTNSDYLVSSDATADDFSNSNYAINKNSYSDYFENVTGGSEDLRLKNTSNNLWGLSGTDLSGEFTIDIEGETRSAWDVGGDEYVVVGAISPTGVFYGPLVGPTGGPI